MNVTNDSEGRGRGADFLNFKGGEGDIGKNLVGSACENYFLSIFPRQVQFTKISRLLL